MVLQHLAGAEVEEPLPPALQRGGEGEGRGGEGKGGEGRGGEGKGGRGL